jgi:hypothetical protein
VLARGSYARARVHGNKCPAANSENFAVGCRFPSESDGKSRYLRSEDEEWRIANIPGLAEHARKAQPARDGWMERARAEIEYGC